MGHEDKILEVTLVPAGYLIIFICWGYCIWCIWMYFKTMIRQNSNNASDEILSSKNDETKALVRTLHYSCSIGRGDPKRNSIWDSPAIYRAKTQVQKISQSSDTVQQQNTMEETDDNQIEYEYSTGRTIV